MAGDGGAANLGVTGQAEADRDGDDPVLAGRLQAGQEAKFSCGFEDRGGATDYQSNVAQYQAAVNQRKPRRNLAYDFARSFKDGQW